MTEGYLKKTIETYNRSAKQMAEHFATYTQDSALPEEITKAFELSGNPPGARVVEIGCGAGKDAMFLNKLSGWYEGFDPSPKLLEIARASVPGASFVQADALSYEYPKNLDMVSAFASMLHLDKADFRHTCQKVSEALRPGGTFCLVLKEADQYKFEHQIDEFGERIFFFYNSNLVQELAVGNLKLSMKATAQSDLRRKPGSRSY